MGTTNSILVVCGARRTGTTLLSAVLSSSPVTPELPGEAQLIHRWLASYRWALEDFEIRALPFFADRAAFRTFYTQLIDTFVSHCFDAFPGSTSLMLKSPEISLYFSEALELLPDAKFVIATRDPRDQVASEWSIHERRLAEPTSGWRERKTVRLRPFKRIARQYVNYYEPVLAAETRYLGRVHFVKYEDLVQHPARTLADLGEFTGLDLSGYEPSAPWPRVADTYWAYGSRPGDTPLYGAAIDKTRVGAYGDVMSEREARRVQGVCAGVAARLGYPESAG
jgi:hypothetical protein